MANSPDIPRPSPERASELKGALADINTRISTAVQCSIHPTLHPTLVAVSKYKPASDIAGVYDAGHRDFGENYVNELLEKAPMLPEDIRWHFIGHLQSNKVKSLTAIPNLYSLHTLTSIKLATALQNARHAAFPSAAPLNVFIQVNTSGEDAKSGLAPLHMSDLTANPSSRSEPDSVAFVARYILTFCPSLRLTGLMTIGALANSLSSSSPSSENPDFKTLIRTRNILEEILVEEYPRDQCTNPWGDDHGRLVLSMGMSSDFEAAVAEGSGTVRVGTGIFGEREKKAT
ncbi:hypothetical protein BU17DRAFT_83426 [Hysterangium stoloniferum]|nr:hypothetical protein BU17DRAFT_83426 [Hysterangium stoloniferum]